jgi:hypothetical protein
MSDSSATLPPPPELRRATPAAPWWRSRQLRLVVSGVLLVVGIASFFLSRGGTAEAAQKVVLQPAFSVPHAPFTPSIAAPPPAQLATTATTTPAPRTDAAAPTSGSSPGLYGGTRDAPSCDAARLVSYLGANPEKGRLWAEASRIKPTDIRAYVATLTPAVLRLDVSVTDFALAGNRLAARQVVLQAGTAVLLDRAAFPRVRCVSGNPLAEPRPVVKRPRYQGPQWPGFQPTGVVIIRPAPVVILVLVDIVNGLVFVRIPGSIVIIDIDQPPPGATIAVVPPGGLATVRGQNWPPGTPVTITFDNPAVTLGTATATGDGNVAADVTVPETAAVGVHQVTIAGGGLTAAQPLYVIPRAVRRV